MLSVDVSVRDRSIMASFLFLLLGEFCAMSADSFACNSARLPGPGGRAPQMPEGWRRPASTRHRSRKRGTPLRPVPSALSRRGDHAGILRRGLGTGLDVWMEVRALCGGGLLSNSCCAKRLRGGSAWILMRAVLHAAVVGIGAHTAGCSHGRALGEVLRRCRAGRCELVVPRGVGGSITAHSRVPLGITKPRKTINLRR